MSGTGLLLEGALVVLLLATMFHAVRLERALGVLRRDRAALEGLVNGFNSATRQAEAGIDRLRGAVDGAGRQVARQIDSATLLKDDLGFLIERGEKLADRLDDMVRDHRPDLAMPPNLAMPRVTRLEPAGARVSHSVPSAPPPSPPDEPPEAASPRVRSQAERDLLRALRMAR
jgi:hypothetical protein